MEISTRGSPIHWIVPMLQQKLLWLIGINMWMIYIGAWNM